MEVDPDVLIVIGGEEQKQEIMSNPAYASLKAVQNDNVTAIDLSEVIQVVFEQFMVLTTLVKLCIRNCMKMKL